MDYFLRPLHYLGDYTKVNQADMIEVCLDLFLFVSNLILIWTLIEIFQNLFPTQNIENYEILKKKTLQFEKYLFFLCQAYV